MPLKIVRTLVSRRRMYTRCYLGLSIAQSSSFPGRFQSLVNFKRNRENPVERECIVLAPQLLIFFFKYRLSRNATYKSWKGLVLVVISIGQWDWGWVAGERTLYPCTTVLKTKRMSTSYGTIGCYFLAWEHRKPSMGFYPLFFFFFTWCIYGIILNYIFCSQPRRSTATP